jgi:peptide/nickel transport system substrate-binding protein
VQTTSISFLRDYVNLFLLMRDENHTIVPLLASEWALSDAGFQFTIHPKARWHDGTPVTAEDIKWHFEAVMGAHTPKFKNDRFTARFKEDIAEVQVIDSKHVFIKTTKPIPTFTAFYTGSGYHSVWFGPAHYLQQVEAEGYEKKPVGGGPYTVKEWKPGERIVLERWEDFWGDTPWYHKPQHKTLEIMLVPDTAARFALLKSRQVDVAVNIPYALAKDLPRSEAAGQRGVNPNKRNIWTQTITATGNYNLVFVNLQAIKDSPNKPTPEELKPFDDIRVREAMELALDKAAISQKVHFGFSKPMSGLWFSEAFGSRPERQVSPYDPARARQLLTEAGYPNGFSTTIHWGAFVNSPGIKEWLEAAASFWKDVGIEVKIFEYEPTEFISRCCRPAPGAGGGSFDRKLRPLIVQTWGRQEHGGIQAGFGYHENGTYICCWDAYTTERWRTLNSTTDEAVQLQALTALEDHVLAQRWQIPMAEVSMVIGYSDRVLAHPTAPHASAFEQLWRIVARGEK